jgi:hypothetical protein
MLCEIFWAILEALYLKDFQYIAQLLLVSSRFRSLPPDASVYLGKLTLPDASEETSDLITNSDWRVVHCTMSKGRLAIGYEEEKHSACLDHPAMFALTGGSLISKTILIPRRVLMLGETHQNHYSSLVIWAVKECASQVLEPLSVPLQVLISEQKIANPDNITFFSPYHHFSTCPGKE